MRTHGLHVLAAFWTAVAASPGILGEESPAPAPPGGTAPVRRTDATDVSEVNVRLLSLQGQIRIAREGALKARKQQNDEISRLRNEQRLVQRTVDVLTEELERKEKDLAEKTATLAKESAAEAAAKKPAAAMLEAMKAYLDEVEEHIEQGIPWKIAERKAAVDQVRRESVTAADANPASALAAVGRIHQEEEALGRLIESATVPVDLGKDEALAVQAFHFGLLAVIFANEDGTVAGFARAGETLEKALDAALGKTGAAQGYLTAVDILRRRRTPTVIDLHIPSLPVRTEETER